MAEATPPRPESEDAQQPCPRPPRPRWVIAVLFGAGLLLAFVLVLHLTGNGFGPGSHLP